MNNQKTIKETLKLVLGPIRWKLVLRFILAAVWPLDRIIFSIMFKVILDRINTSTPETMLANLKNPFIIFFSVGFCANILGRGSELLTRHIEIYLKKDLSHRLMSRMMLQSRAFFQDHFAGALGSRVRAIVVGLPEIIGHLASFFFPAYLTLFLASAAFWYLGPVFLGLLWGWVIVFHLLTFLTFKPLNKVSTDAAIERSRVVGKIVDTLGNISNIRFFANREAEEKNLDKQFDKSLKKDLRLDKYLVIFFAVRSSTFALYYLATVVMLVVGYKNGSITMGDFALVLTIDIMLIQWFWSMAEKLGEFMEDWGAVREGLGLVYHPIKVLDQPGAKKMQVTEGKISFEGVKFHYKGAEPLFKDLSIEIPAGQKVGLVGFSGSGKSTFVNLILRIFDIDEGKICIDGQDIKTVTQDSLHEAIGMIPQEPTLFNRSLKENLCYGSPKAEDREVVSATTKAHSHAFIMAMPEGYQSMVGERGVKLSGGQRQRIAIARGFLKNAPILMLDEATSQLDSITEVKIQDSLEELMKGKTTLIIAHRLSTLQKMDRILVFDKGKIVQDGTHASLQKEKGLYQRLWDEQVGSFLPR